MQSHEQQARAKTKGKMWFGMEAPEMTEERKNDLKVVQMRNALDPTRFYKNTDVRPGLLPKFFQVHVSYMTHLSQTYFTISYHGLL